MTLVTVTVRDASGQKVGQIGFGMRTATQSERLIICEEALVQIQPDCEGSCTWLTDQGRGADIGDIFTLEYDDTSEQWEYIGSRESQSIDHLSPITLWKKVTA